MEKNITPNQNIKKPSFIKIFLYTFMLFLVFNMFFRKGEDKKDAGFFNIPSKLKFLRRDLVSFKTASLSGQFNKVGLRIDDVLLNKYKQSIKKDSLDVEMLKYFKEDSLKSSYVEVGLLGVDAENNFFPTNDTEWKMDSHNDNSIVLSFINKAKVKFVREMSFDDNYMLTIKDRVINNSPEEIEFYPYSRVVRSNDMAVPASSSHNGFVGYLGESLEEITYSKIISSKGKNFSSSSGWLGFGSDYFMTMLVIDNNVGKVNARVLEVFDNKAQDKDSKIHQFQADFVRDLVSVKKGGMIDVVSRVYIGAKVPEIIAKYSEMYSIPKFDLVIDYGYFYILSKPFTQILKWFYGLSGNFGVAIILFTILIRLLMFPIAQKSFKSMDRMRKLQPEMKKIQVMYAKDKPRMNMELAKLYKKSGVNPLSGCLPLLVQIPVFFALYKSLVISIDMRQAPFTLWIQNLSAPDPTTIFNLFGLLPYQPWEWLPHLGVLPLIMGLTMYVQQKMQPVAGMDATQAKVMKWLPLLFTFMFAGLPAGLVLYWTVNNILSILQQKYIR